MSVFRAKLRQSNLPTQCSIRRTRDGMQAAEDVLRIVRAIVNASSMLPSVCLQLVKLETQLQAVPGHPHLMLSQVLAEGGLQFSHLRAEDLRFVRSRKKLSTAEWRSVGPLSRAPVEDHHPR